MTELVTRVSEAVERFGMLHSGDCAAVALSGGADSVSLLYALKELERPLGITLSAVHINHCLRGEESDGDERFCRELCERLGVALKVYRIDVLSLREKHESVEECARRARYGAFSQTLNELGGRTFIATAHNAGDSAETMLINLMRGTGLKGLCGVPPVRGRFVRPLIYCTRAMVEDYLRSMGQEWVTDSTNLSDDYTRNRVRHIIIPEMERINGAFFTAVTRAQDSLREDSDFLTALAERELEAARSGRGWNAAALAALPAPLRSRAVRKILADGGIEPSALRINTAISLLEKRSARFNPCRDRFFTIRKGVCFVEHIEQHYKKHEK